MQNLKNQAGNLLPVTVMEGLTVTVLPNLDHEFLMSTADVAKGYGVSGANIREHKRMNSELVEGKHFISAVRNSDSDYAVTICHSAPHNKIFWTKRGIVRLGFFIKSERAKLFRDWAEELIIKVDEQKDLFGGVVTVPARRLREKRLINRLDRDRLIRLLALTSRVDDKDLRISITNELTGGLNYGNL